MKQEQEETTIKELLQRLKQEDERRAPSFADSWAAARSRLETRDQSVRAQASNWRRWSLAAVAAILIAFDESPTAIAACITAPDAAP